MSQANDMVQVQDVGSVDMSEGPTFDTFDSLRDSWEAIVARIEEYFGEHNRRMPSDDLVKESGLPLEILVFLSERTGKISPPQRGPNGGGFAPKGAVKVATLPTEVHAQLTEALDRALENVIGNANPRVSDLVALLESKHGVKVSPKDLEEILTRDQAYTVKRGKVMFYNPVAA